MPLLEFSDTSFKEPVPKFKAAISQREARRRSNNVRVRKKASTFSLSGLAKCGICKQNIATHRNHNDQDRLYCRGRAKGWECSFKGTFLEVYEDQILWYLQTFFIPIDYREKILEAHRKIANAYDNINKQRINLQNRLERLQEQYEWGHKSKDDYLDKYTQIRHKLDILTPPETDTRMLNRFAHFLESVPDAWEAATQEQRNRLASELFEDVIVEHNRVLGVKPKAELKPFFQLSYEEHQKYHKRPRWDSNPRSSA